MAWLEKYADRLKKWLQDELSRDVAWYVNSIQYILCTIVCFNNQRSLIFHCTFNNGVGNKYHSACYTYVIIKHLVCYCSTCTITFLITDTLLLYSPHITTHILTKIVVARYLLCLAPKAQHPEYTKNNIIYHKTNQNTYYYLCLSTHYNILLEYP